MKEPRHLKDLTIHDVQPISDEQTASVGLPDYSQVDIPGPWYKCVNFGVMIDSGLVGYHESRRCSRDTYPESYVTQCTSICS